MIETEALSCQELVELVTDYLEGALDERHRRAFDAHLVDCDGCTEYLEQLRMTIRITGTLTRADLAPAVEDALLHAFRTWKSGS